MKVLKDRYLECDIEYNIVLVTKYKYGILRGNTAIRIRDIIKDCCYRLNYQKRFIIEE